MRHRPLLRHCLIPMPLALALLAGCAVTPSVAPSEPAAAAVPGGLPAPAALARAPDAAASSAVPLRSPVAAPGAAASAAASAPMPPGAPPPFAVVIKDAKQIDGPITAWQKDDKLWLELAPEQFGKPFMLSPKLSTGIGEAFILGGLMAYPGQRRRRAAGGGVRARAQPVRLQARNQDVIAKAGTPEARAMAASYSPSLLGSVPVASQPHPQRKTVLIEADGLFLSDMLGVGMQLQRAFRQGYSLDPRNSVDHLGARLAAVAGDRDAEPLLLASIGVPQPGTPARACRYRRCRATLPDTRSLFVGHHYSLAPLPAEPMPPRRADARIGLMTQTVLDFSDDLARSPRVRMVERWRLEKKDPQADAVRAGQADHLLDRPQRAAEVPRSGHRRHPRMEQGLREDRLQERDRGASSRPTTPSSTPSTWAIRRCAG